MYGEVAKLDAVLGVTGLAGVTAAGEPSENELTGDEGTGLDISAGVFELAGVVYVNEPRGDGDR